LSASDVSRRTSALGERIPTPTLLKIESARQEPGVRRFYSLLRLYDIPFDIVPDLLELESMAVAPPEEADPELLLKESVELWQHGRIGEALARVFAVREASSRGEAGRRTRQRVLLSFSIMARHLGKIVLAERLVHDVLKDDPDADILPNLLIQAAAVWEDLGAIEASLAFAERAAARIDPTDARRVGWVVFQKARCLCAQGQVDAALGELDEAERRFAECGDTEHEVKTRISRARFLLAAGDAAAATAVAAAAAIRADGLGLKLVQAEALLASGEALLAGGSAPEAVRSLRQALGLAEAMDDRDLLFRVNFRLWKAYEQVQNLDRARLARESAVYFVKFIEKRSPEAAEARGLDLSGGRDAPSGKRTRRGRR